MTTDLTSRLAAIIQELTAPQVVEVKAARYVRVALAVQLTGYSDKAIRRKMEDGVWVEPLAGRFRRVAEVLKLFHRGCKPQL